MDADAYHQFGLVGTRRMGPLGCAASQEFRGRSQAIETALRLNPNCQHSVSAQTEPFVKITFF